MDGKRHKEAIRKALSPLSMGERAEVRGMQGVENPALTPTPLP
jgi:hypothetical protein